MVQFNLPKNSKILKGKYFKDKTGTDPSEIHEHLPPYAEFHQEIDFRGPRIDLIC